MIQQTIDQNSWSRKWNHHLDDLCRSVYIHTHRFIPRLVKSRTSNELNEFQKNFFVWNRGIELILFFSHSFILYAKLILPLKTQLISISFSRLHNFLSLFHLPQVQVREETNNWPLKYFHNRKEWRIISRLLVFFRLTYRWRWKEKESYFWNKQWISQHDIMSLILSNLRLSIHTGDRMNYYYYLYRRCRCCCCFLLVLLLITFEPLSRLIFMLHEKKVDSWRWISID